MIKCSCYHTITSQDAVSGTATTEEKCFGTKEIETCKCKGNPLACDFYPVKRTESTTKVFSEIITELNDTTNNTADIITTAKHVKEELEFIIEEMEKCTADTLSESKN